MARAAAASSPKCIADFPEYAAAAKRLADLHEQLARAEQESTDVLTQILQQRAGYAAAVDARAEAIAGGRSWEDTQELPQDALQQRHRELEAGVRAIRRAIDLQQGRCDRARGEASAAACAPLKPKHKALVRRVANAMLDLSRAVEAERRFRFEIEQAGYVVLLPTAPYNLDDIGQPEDVSASRAWHLLYEGAQSGFWTEAERVALMKDAGARLTVEDV